MRGLRTQLVVLTALAIAVAVAALALFSRQAVNTEYRRFLGRTPAAGLAAVADSLAGQEPRGGMDALLARLAPATGHDLVVVDSTGSARAASVAPLKSAHFEWGAGGLLRVRGAEGWVLELHRPEQVPLGPGAVLVALPPGIGERGPRPAPPFLRAVDQRLAVGAALALALGLALAWMVGGRLVRPIERLTAAARRVAAGDLTARVPIRGKDELADLGTSFNAMAQALAEQAARRQQLTADVAHELRTPLGHLRGYVEAIQDGLVAPDATALATIHSEVLHLARLVEDLEQLAAADEGRLALRREDVGVQAAVHAALAPFAGAFAEREVTLRVDVDEGAAVCADRDRLAQVVRNLVENALAHSPPGSKITITARAPRSADEPVVLVVADEGEGIPAEHQARVFERFYRVDASRSRTTGGSGLGLAIVKHLVEAHGGSVALERAPAAGTRVIVTLPGARAEGA